jgi:thymidine phosphorylase
VDPAVGVADLAKVGERVAKGQRLATVHANDEARLAEANRLLREAFVLADAPVETPPLVAERVA